MGKLLSFFALLAVLTAFPAAALAGGSGAYTCPPGLTSERLKAEPALVKELADAARPLKRHGMVLFPYSVEPPEKGEQAFPATYDYVWGGENEHGRLASFLVCGVKTLASNNGNYGSGIAIGILIGGGLLGLLIMVLRRL